MAAVGAVCVCGVCGCVCDDVSSDVVGYDVW